MGFLRKGIGDEEEYFIKNSSIKPKADYTIDIFVDNEYENKVPPGATYEFGLYTNRAYTLLCTAAPHQWGPIKITLKKGAPYT